MTRANNLSALCTSSLQECIAKHSRISQDTGLPKSERWKSLQILNQAWKILQCRLADATSNSGVQECIAKHSRIYQDTGCRKSLQIVNDGWNIQYQAETNKTKSVCINLSKNESRIFNSANNSLKVNDNITGKLLGVDVEEEKGEHSDSAVNPAILNPLGIFLEDDVDPPAALSEEEDESTDGEENDNEESSQASSDLELVTHYDSSDDDSSDGDEDDESSLPDSDEDEEAFSDLDGQGDGDGRAGEDVADRAGVDGNGGGQAELSDTVDQVGGMPASDYKAGVPVPDAAGQTGVTEPLEAATTENDGDCAPEPQVLISKQPLIVAGNQGLALSAHGTSLVPVPPGSPTERHDGKETNYDDFNVVSDSFNDEEDPRNHDEEEQAQEQEVTVTAIPTRPVALRRSRRLRQEKPDELLESQTITVAVVAPMILLRRSTRIRRRPDYYTPRWD